MNRLDDAEAYATANLRALCIEVLRMQAGVPAGGHMQALVRLLTFAGLRRFNLAEHIVATAAMQEVLRAPPP